MNKYLDDQPDPRSKMYSMLDIVITQGKFFETKKRGIRVIFDNIDQLPREMVRETNLIQHRLGTIISIVATRSTTEYQNINDQLQGHHLHETVVIAPPPLDSILKNRIEIFHERLSSIQPDNSTGETHSLLLRSISQVINQYFDQTIDYISMFSGNNMRLAVSLFERVVVCIVPDEKHTKLKFPSIKRAILLGDNQPFEGRVNLRPIMNLFDSPHSKHNSIELVNILRLLANNEHQFRADKFISYLEDYLGCDEGEIVTFLNYLSSAESRLLVFSEADRLTSRRDFLSYVSITQLGTSYLRKVLFDFDYLWIVVQSVRSRGEIGSFLPSGYDFQIDKHLKRYKLSISSPESIELFGRMLYHLFLEQLNANLRAISLSLDVNPSYVQENIFAEMIARMADTLHNVYQHHENIYTKFAPYWGNILVMVFNSYHIQEIPIPSTVKDVLSKYEDYTYS